MSACPTVRSSHVRLSACRQTDGHGYRSDERWYLGNICPSVRMISEISETIRATTLGFACTSWASYAAQIVVSVDCHAHSMPTNRRNLWLLQFWCKNKKNILTEMYCCHQYLSIDPKVCHAHFNTHQIATPTLTPINRSHFYAHKPPTPRHSNALKA